MKASNIEEYFGTLQQSTVEAWKSHLKASKHDVHVVLDEFYKDIVEKVDALIEAYQGLHDKVEDYKNLMSTDKMDPIEYLEELHELVTDGKESFLEEEELKSAADDVLNLIDSTLYKLKDLTKTNEGIKSLKDYLTESLL